MEYNLDMDTSTSPYELGQASDISRSSKLSEIKLWARLPQRLYKEYGNNTNAQLPTSCGVGEKCDVDEDRIPNDLVIDWSMEGKHKQNGTENSFRIVPRVDVNYVSGTVRDYSDTLIRESHINATTGNKATATRSNNYNPVASTSTISIASQNIIAPGNVVTNL